MHVVILAYSFHCLVSGAPYFRDGDDQGEDGETNKTHYRTIGTICLVGALVSEDAFPGPINQSYLEANHFPDFPFLPRLCDLPLQVHPSEDARRSLRLRLRLRPQKEHRNQESTASTHRARDTKVTSCISIATFGQASLSGSREYPLASTTRLAAPPRQR